MKIKINGKKFIDNRNKLIKYSVFVNDKQLQIDIPIEEKKEATVFWKFIYDNISNEIDFPNFIKFLKDVNNFHHTDKYDIMITNVNNLEELCVYN